MIENLQILVDILCLIAGMGHCLFSVFEKEPAKKDRIFIIGLLFLILASV